MTHDTAAHASEIRDALQTLAKLPAGAPVVSAYLDTRWDDEQQRERLRIEVKHRLQQIRYAYEGHPEMAGVEATLEELEHHVDGLVNQSDDAATDFDGVAIFASVPRALWIVYRSRVAFETEVTVSDRPRLQPLARLLDDYQSAFVALVDPRRVRDPGDRPGRAWSTPRPWRPTSPSTCSSGATATSTAPATPAGAPWPRSSTSATSRP